MLHKQAGQTTVLTKCCKIAEKRLHCRSHPQRTFEDGAANGSKEPILPNAAKCLNGGYSEAAKNATKSMVVLPRVCGTRIFSVF